MRDLVILTHVFPPSNAIAARRFGEIAPHLQTFGYQPWIITTKSLGDTPPTLPLKNIIYINENDRGELINAKWAADRFAIRSLENLGLRPIFLDPSLWNWGWKILRNQSVIRQKIPNPCCILGSFGPSSTLLAARFLSKKWAIPYIADFRDLGALRDDKRKSIIKLLDRVLESRWVRSSEAMITVSKTLASILEAKYKKPTKVIYNGYIQAEKIIPAQKSSSDKYIHYAGQLYPHRMPAMYLLLAALKLIPRLKFVLRLLGPRYLERQLVDRIEEWELTSQIEFRPPCSTEMALAEGEDAVANIVLEDLSTKHESSKGGITGKFLALLPLRPPILAIARGDSEIGEILDQTGRGQLCCDEAKTLQFLNEILENSSAYVGNAASIATFSKYAQAKELAIFLDHVLN